MTRRRDQSLHDAMVRSMVIFLEENGYMDIRANIPGRPSPKTTQIPLLFKQAHTPDITTEKSGTIHIFEIEPGNDLTISSAKNRWINLDLHAQRTISNLRIVAPEPDKPKADTWSV